ncbi:MAG: hypothetical protein E6600_04295 [Anaerocolumna aminovalerica]|uniref:hypothetical protein n=1 Tax=Anaerocolumna aminovalerica TaxID=1527 RepID=UPI002908E3B0|nr:hypothetical protein [Anaerocolumna aminovalerica]MDU6263706.1 hypothetical protein [Anaerocolumna aminovalerica]
MEIDRLEIAIQSEASRASADLDKVIKKLNILSGTLGNINTDAFKNMASGINEFAGSVQNASNIKTSAFTRLSKNIDKIVNTDSYKLGRLSGSLKEVAASIDGVRKASLGDGDIFKGMPKANASINKNIIREIDFNSIGALREFNGTFAELTKEIKSSESQLDKFLRQEEKLDTIGVDKTSKRYVNLQYDIAEVCNWLDILYDKQNKVSGQDPLANMTIQHHLFPDAVFKSFDDLNLALNELNSNDAVDELSASLGNLSSVTMPGEVASSLQDISSESVKAAANIGVSTNEIKGSFDKVESGIQNVVSEIDVYNEYLNNLEGKGLYFGDKEYDKAYQRLNQLNAELNQYKKNLISTKSNQNEASNSIDKFSKSLDKATVSSGRTDLSLSKLVATVYSLKKAFDFIGNSIKKSMDFTETTNLFHTTYKKVGMEAARASGLEWGSEAANKFAIGFINEAQSFNDKITDALSLDPSTIMNYQAVFAQMSNSFGLTSQSVMNMSKSFTMLGLDLSSLFNTDTEKAMIKLRSGLAGQSEPLREWGIDVSEATLKMTALNYGIEDSVSKMSQAAKTQLRWLAIMDQAEVAFGDMAKTIDSPANQLRILQQQWNNLSRSIGNVFLPIVRTVLPYINALVIAIRRMVDALATAVGFELPDYSDSDIYTNITGGIGGVADAADDATDSTNKLKKALLGIDELNILSEGKTKKSSGGSGGGSGYPVLDDEISKKTNSYMAKFNEELANMKNKAEELADKIQPKLEGFIKLLDDISPALKGIAAAFVTYKIVTWFMDLAKSIGALSMSPAGVIAIAVGALAFLISAIQKYNDKLVEKDLAKRFGDITLSLEEIEDVANRLTDSEYAAKIDIYVEEKAKLEEIEKKIEADLKTLNKLNWKVSIGMELTAGEKEQYKTAIDSFIKNSQDYIEQRHYVVDLALSATITNDSAFLLEMQTMTNEYFNGSKGEMEALGKKLRTTVDEAFADGILDANEQKVIMDLQKEMSEVVQSLADAEFQAKMQMLTIDYEGIDITKESFEKLTEEIQAITQERLKKIEEARYSVLTTINQSYTVKMKNATTQAERNAIQKEWDSTVNEYTREFSKTKSTITLEGITFSIDSLTKKYKTEIDKTSPIVQQSVKDAIEKGMYWGYQDISQDTDGALKDAYELPFERLVSDMANFYEKQLTDTLPSATRKGAAEMFETLSPTTNELKKIYDDSVKAGDQVPEGISKALTDIANIGAIAGDLDSINYLIGQKLSTDETFLEALSKSETAGKDLNKSLIAGLKSGIPDLKLQGDELVFSVDDAIKKASGDSAENNMPLYSKNLVDGLNKGISDNQNTSKPKVEKWASGVNNWFKDVTNKSVFEKYASNLVTGLNTGVMNNYSSSKSKLETWGRNVNTWFSDISSKSQFKGYGENIVSGLNSGVSGNSNSSKNIFQSWASSIKGWFTSAFDIHSPSRVAFGWAKNIVQGFNNGISSMADSSKSYMDDWADSIGDITANIGIGVNDTAVKSYFPTTSDLFYENTNDIPGLVGNIGRNNVANGGQIAQDFSGGVANAVADTLVPILMNMSGGNDGNQNITVESNLYVDSEKMYSISQKGEAKSRRRYQTALQN